MKRTVVTAFGLIEVLIAAALVATAIGALFAVSAMTVRLTTLAQDRLIASQLAREGIEVARQIRDTNFVSETCLNNNQANADCYNWWNGLSAPGTHAVFGVETDEQRGFKLQAIETQSCGDITERNLTRDPAIPRNPQLFCRRLFIEPVGDLRATPVDESKTSLRIRSQVAWLGSGRNAFRAISVSEDNSCPAIKPRLGTRPQLSEWCTEQVTLLTDWRPQL